MKVTIEQLRQWDKESYVCLDIRGQIPYQHGHIEGAVCFGEGDVRNETEHEQLLKNVNGKKVVVYCSYGEKSKDVVEQLYEKGIEAYNLEGGFRAWLLDNAVEKKEYSVVYEGQENANEKNVFSRDEILRYDRQMILPQIGMKGQQKLKEGRVLIVGAGGLGSPAGLYLAGAGVGKIGIIDADEVSLSNLQRQIIHRSSNVHENKAISAARAMRELNDTIEYKVYTDFLTAENVEEIVAGYDFVIDGADNFETKFLINDACVLLKKAFCHAGILQFQGQLMTYVPKKGPCYRCIFEEIPAPGSVPNCSQAGVSGALAGIIGSMQALEAVKYLTGAGELLTGKILQFNGLTMKSRILKFPRGNRSCRVCGEKADIRSVRENREEYRRQGYCFFL